MQFMLGQSPQCTPGTAPAICLADSTIMPEPRQPHLALMERPQMQTFTVE